MDNIENQQLPEQADRQRAALVRLIQNRFDDDAGREWLKARLAELGTTWTTATKTQVRTIAIELIKLRVAAPKPQETAEPTGDRNVLAARRVAREYGDEIVS
jgi:hypothetical protein